MAGSIVQEVLHDQLPTLNFTTIRNWDKGPWQA